ncbi:5-deoxy-glucuronate isomerase [Streptomyces sp. S.PB5]|uniref:5-deoxy-glucuronate isomerase n=1 Tax=Streptomyces sp. S.PB5 TaxID=3020844 RepID=UPI0025AFB62C|nr:5-deoxy-glucuronate isomerase [Streptomyces sp. S.PB5]MDN3025540.1 5-deoxy-glucuronate isomerase [Streptomyces sp. S.PB5]
MLGDSGRLMIVAADHPARGGAHTFDTGESEWIALPLAGSCTVTTAGEFGGARCTRRLPARHGPSMAVPGHHMYCLNVMAGPGAERVRLIRDHPDHTGIRATWPAQRVAPRLPLHTAPEKS